jgi:hypothetical protein
LEPIWPVVFEIDTSDFEIRAFLSQIIDRRLHPISYHSRKINKANINCEINDKDLLAKLSAFKEWRHYLKVAAHRISAITNHNNVEYFMTTMSFNRTQARSAQDLA